MSSPLFVQDSISRAQSASPFPWSPTQDGFTIPSISSVRSVQGSPDRVQFRFKRRFCILTYSQVPPDFLMRGLARAYIATADCAPYHENCTRMAELTTMLSWTINACEIDRQSRWDVAGHHPNITPVSRTPYKALEYVSKDCDITHDCFDESNRPRRDSGRPKGNGKRKWSEIISAPDENSFLESPRKMIRVLWWFVTETSDNTLGGDTPLNDDIMNRLPGSPSESTSTRESKRSLHESDSEVGTATGCRLRPCTPCHAGQPVPPAPLCGT